MSFTPCNGLNVISRDVRKLWLVFGCRKDSTYEQSVVTFRSCDDSTKTGILWALPRSTSSQKCFTNQVRFSEAWTTFCHHRFGYKVLSSIRCRRQGWNLNKMAPGSTSLRIIVEYALNLNKVNIQLYEIPSLSCGHFFFR